MIGDFDLALGSEGKLSSLYQDDPRYGACEIAEARESMGTLSCTFPERSGGCEIALIENTEADPTETLPLLDVAVYDNPTDGSRFAGGYTFGMALLESEIAVVTSGRLPQSWHCQALFLSSESEVVFVDRERFEITRTATAAPCLRWPLRDPRDPSGFLAYFLEGGEPRWGRFDREARLTGSVSLGSFEEWILVDTVALSSSRVALIFQRADIRRDGRVLFVKVDGPNLEIEQEALTAAGQISAGSRISDSAVALLADDTDNIRIIDLEGERGLRYVVEDCGIANLSAAGFWMSEDESLAVSAFMENGTLLVMEPRTGQCRFAHAPTHPEVIDPQFITRAGNELAVSFWSRNEPRSAFIGRFDLEQRHMTRAFTPLGPGVINDLVADESYVYATVSDRAQLVRVAARP